MKNDLPTSDSAEESKEFRRNPSPGSNNHKALAVVQDLSWGSIFPLLAIFFKYGSFLIYYLRASRGGLRLGSLLRFFKITVGAPLKINDFHYTDTSHAIYWNTQYQVVNACRNQLDHIESLINKYLPKCKDYMKKILAANVSKAWQVWLLEANLLRATAKLLGKQEGVPANCVVLVSRHASLLKILNLNSSVNNEVLVWSQPNQNKVLLFPLAATGLSFLEVLQNFFNFNSSRSKAIPSNLSRPFKVGVTAAWGTEGMDKKQKDDLFWWRSSSVSGNRLIYMFEREDTQPTRNRVKQVEEFGIQSVALKPKFAGDFPDLLVKNNSNPSFLMSLRFFCFQLKLASKILFADKFAQAVLALVSWQYYAGKKLSSIYKTLNLKGVFHFEEAGMDIISLASFMNNSTRIGTHWACHTGINHTSGRNHQVYFLWGSHDAKLALDSGSISRTLLIAGCFLSDHPPTEAHKNTQEIVKEMRDKGVRYVLTLLDSSLPCPEFYRFFLQWLVEDPCLGLLIKSKGKSWKEVQNDGLNGLVERAENSNRIHEMNPLASPADAAMSSDFTVGITSITALAVAALQGARVIFLDYERVDQGPQKPYCILHSLGSNRCVFYEPDLLRRAITKNFKNPEANPSLGDATPILDQLDPFRDGKASQRIGEFVEWYLEGLDGGINTDDATRLATDRYANKWGQDKVVRSL